MRALERGLRLSPGRLLSDLLSRGFANALESQGMSGVVRSLRQSDRVQGVAGPPVRQRPTHVAPILDRLSSGERVVVLDRRGDWYKVVGHGVEGWVRADAIRLEFAY